MKKIDQVKQKLKGLSWDELAGDLINLEIVYQKNKHGMKPGHVKSIKSLISLYEKEKKQRIERTFDLNKLIQDEQFVAFDWTSEIKD